MPARSAETGEPVTDRPADFVGSVLLNKVSPDDCDLSLVRPGSALLKCFPGEKLPGCRADQQLGHWAAGQPVAVRFDDLDHGRRFAVEWYMAGPAQHRSATLPGLAPRVPICF